MYSDAHEPVLSRGRKWGQARWPPSTPARYDGDTVRGRKRHGVGWSVAVLIVLVLLPLPTGYVLSVGPAARMVSQEQLSPALFAKMYAPVFVCRRLVIANRVLEHYMNLWLGP